MNPPIVQAEERPHSGTVRTETMYMHVAYGLHKHDFIWLSSLTSFVFHQHEFTIPGSSYLGK